MFTEYRYAIKHVCVRICVMYVCVCVSACRHVWLRKVVTCVYIQACVCIYIYTYIYICICISMPTYIHIHIYTYIHIHKYVCSEKGIFMCVRVHVLVDISSSTCACLCYHLHPCMQRPLQVCSAWNRLFMCRACLSLHRAFP